MPAPSPQVAERRRPRTTQACMVSCVSKGRDRAHLSCAAVPSVSPGPYRRGRWLCWSCSRLIFLWFLPSSSSISSSLPFSGFCRACRGFFFVHLVAARGGRRVCFRFHSCFFEMSLVFASAVGPPPLWCSLFSPCSLSTSQSPLVWIAPSYLSPSKHLYCFWWTSTRNCILAIFRAFPSRGVPARWRDLRSVVLGICRK